MKNPTIKCKYCKEELGLDTAYDFSIISNCTGKAYCQSCAISIYKSAEGRELVVKEQYLLQ